jgi:mRNA-degrading endonuclease toxin of MazEF toxin-antitoxin module
MERGDIAWVNFPEIKDSHIQGGKRPAILIATEQLLRGTNMRMVVHLHLNRPLLGVRSPLQ